MIRGTVETFWLPHSQRRKLSVVTHAVFLTALETAVGFVAIVFESRISRPAEQHNETLTQKFKKSKRRLER